MPYSITAYLEMRPATESLIQLFSDTPSQKTTLESSASAVAHVRAPRKIFPVPFIVGVPRSGTTLLRLMLDAHPQLAIPHETHFLFDLLGDSRLILTKPTDFCDFLTGHFTWPDFDLDEGEFRQAVAAIEPFKIEDALRVFYRMYAARFGKARWGEKTPDYGNIMLEIQTCLPEAHFIHLVRDGRDVAVSKRDLWFGPGQGMAEQANDWIRSVRHSQQSGAACRHFLEIRFEDLLSAPEEILRRVCVFLDLPYDSAMLEYHARADERLAELRGWPEKGITREQFRILHQNTNRPLRHDRIGRWKTELSAVDLSAFQEIAGGTLLAFGYPLAPERSAQLHRSVATRKPTVSLALMTGGLTDESAGWFESARALCDELVIFVDLTKADEATQEHARRIATRVHEVNGGGFIEIHLEEIFRACRGDWILRLDSDEQLSPGWNDGSWRRLLETGDFTHFKCPRRWLHPTGGFIQAEPWWPDVQVRLIRNDPAAIRFTELIHAVPEISGRCGDLRNLTIDHHVLRLLSRAEREAKARRYEDFCLDNSLGHFYRFEDFSPPVAPLRSALGEAGKVVLAEMRPLSEAETTRVRLEAPSIPSCVEPGKMFWIAVRVINETARELSSALPCPICLAYHWRDGASGTMVTFDGVRTALHPRIGPHATESFFALVTAPAIPGEYVLELTLVQESIRWFEEINPAILRKQNVSVLPPA